MLTTYGRTVVVHCWAWPAGFVEIEKDGEDIMKRLVLRFDGVWGGCKMSLRLLRYEGAEVNA